MMVVLGEVKEIIFLCQLNNRGGVGRRITARAKIWRLA
jgi:hypothetical protein